MPAKKGTPGRAISDANLKRTAAITHGAFSAAAVRPLRERFGTELAEAFPNASEAEVTIQAQRLAQLELLGGFLEERGVIAHRRRGTVYPALTLMERIAAAYERQAALLMAREQATAEPGNDLESYLQATYGGEAER